MIYEHTDYRAFLRNLLTERIQKNPAYSLRALARQMGCAPSTLSEILRGQKGLSPARALQAGLKMGLSEDESEYLGLMAQLDQSALASEKDYCLQKMRRLNPRPQVRDLSVDTFKLIADWYHIPLLELAEIQGFQLTADTAAQKLGLTRLESQTALDRLERLELIQKDSNGTYRRQAGRNLVTAHVPNEALRHFHRSMLGKAQESLETQSPTEKIVGSETYAMDSHLLEKARTLTERYFSDMVALSEQSQNKDQLYHLGVQFFRLTPSIKRRNPS